MIGAHALGVTGQYDLAINLDVGLTGDIPGPDSRDFPGRLGAGPMLVHADVSAQYSRTLIRDLEATARATDIPVQHAVFQNYGSDGGAMLKGGVETALVAYPTRYTHSPIETIDLNDLVDTVRLLIAFATTPRLPRV